MSINAKTDKSLLLFIIVTFASICGNIFSIFTNNSYATIEYVDKQIKRSDELTVVRYTQITESLTDLRSSVSVINNRIYQLIRLNKLNKGN
jgi:cell division protein YceG involved in septum cleavage